MNFKIFISSRNNDTSSIDGVTGEPLSELRIHLKASIESLRLLEKEFFDVRINEDFGADTTEDSYQKCLSEVTNSDLIIVLYTKRSGWAPDGFLIGICHAELAAALDVSAKKTVIVDVSEFFPYMVSDPVEIKRDNEFKKYVARLNRFSNPLKLKKADRNNTGLKETLFQRIKTIVYHHLMDRFKMSNIYYDLAGSSQAMLDWKKLKYSERHKQMQQYLKKLLEDNSNFKSIIALAHAIPDSMTVAEAKSFTGRPFLSDHLQIAKANLKSGPIHVIAVYANATESQVKEMIGFPDVSVIQDQYGFYVWEQINHIQLIFLTGCKTTSAIASNFLLFNNWSESSEELSKILSRGKARFLILEATNEAGSKLKSGKLVS